MNTKDWILLLVPILCNGIILFMLQKAFEKKQLALSEKYKYVSIMQKKVDDTLALFTKVLQTTGDDLVQIGWLNKFISGYCDVLYYYQQNQKLFKSLENYMNELINEHEQIQKNQLIVENTESGSEVRIHIESRFRKIYQLLQSIQNDCIYHKV